MVANFSGGLPNGSVDKEPACNVGDRKRGFDPWVRKIPGEGNGNPLQYSCLKNPMDRGAEAQQHTSGTW